MITASTILSAVPNLPDHSRQVLNQLITVGGDPEIHIPGFPSLPPIPGALTKAALDAIGAALAPLSFEFYQVVGVRVSINGNPMGGVGAKVSEKLDIKNPAPQLKFTPIVELGAPKA